MKKKGIRNTMFGNDEPSIVMDEETIEEDLETLGIIIPTKR
jgi:hypothetical protein